MKFRSLIIIAILIAGCSGTNSTRFGSGEKLVRMKGSSTLDELIREWAQRFTETHDGIVIEVQSGTSSSGFEALTVGETDLATASRPLSSEEVSRLAVQYGTLGVTIRCAKDALSVYVHPANPVRTLTLVQAGRIFTGEIENWKEVGGAPVEIHVAAREAGSGSSAFFRDHVLLGEEFTSSATTYPSNEELVLAVMNDRQAIGFGGIALGDSLVHLRIGGIEPTVENVRNGSYPISRYFYINSIREPKGAAKKFIDWILSSEGQRIAQNLGYVPLWEAE